MLEKQEVLASIKNIDGGGEVGSNEKCLGASMVPLSLVKYEEEKGARRVVSILESTERLRFPYWANKQRVTPLTVVAENLGPDYMEDDEITLDAFQGDVCDQYQ